MLEVWLLITVGREIGAPLTILAVIGTAILGVFWLKHQGIYTLQRLQDRLLKREIPNTELLEGVLLLLAGAFLLTPGFATDAIGFTLLMPVSRQWIARFILEKVFMSAAVVDNAASAGRSGRPGSGAFKQYRHNQQVDSQHRDPEIIEGQFSREDED